jgi:hypothetical protein
MAAWFISALSAGIATKQATPLRLPNAERLRATILESLRAIT